MKTAYSQKGLSPIGGLFVAVVGASIFMLVFKLIPHYMDYSAIKKTHEKIALESMTLTSPLKTIQSRVEFLLINHQVRNYDGANTYIDTSTNVPVVGFEYSIKEHMIANGSVVLDFSYEVEIKQ